MFVLLLYIEQEPLTEQEIEDLVAEFLEVESKVASRTVILNVL